MHAVSDLSVVVPGSLRRNATAISTASGRSVPDYVCNAFVNTVATDGSLVRLQLNDALLIPECKHNLVSLNVLAKDLHIASHFGAEGSHLLLPDGRRIQLLDNGVYVIPDTATAVINAAIANDVEPSAAGVSWKLLHNRFNGRSFAALRNLVSSGAAVPRDWHRALRRAPNDQCHACQHARLDRQPSRAHVPPVSIPGLISYDIFEMGTPHINGGQKYVIGFHDAYSRLNKVYLLKSKSQAGEAMDKFYAWARSHQVAIIRFHADNAPELTGNAVKDKWAARGIRVTSCAPHTPRGNGMMERQWRTISTDTRHILATARLPRSMWWYALRASVQTSWAIPINAAETPWSRFTGMPSSPCSHRVVGCLAYYRDVKPTSKADSRSRRAIHLGRAEDQPGYLLMDLQSRALVVTPHVRFFESDFPGLDSQPGGGRRNVEDPDDSLNDNDSDDYPDPFPTALDPMPEAEDYGDAMPNAHVGDDEPPLGDTSPSSPLSDDRDDAVSDESGTNELVDALPIPFERHDERISQRLSRANRGVRTHHNVASFALDRELLTVPSGDYYLYVGSGPPRDGDVNWHLERLGGLPMVPIDIKVGGYDHDITSEDVQKYVLDLGSSRQCKGVFVSIPCKTYSVLRGKSGVEYSYPLRNSNHVLGIPRADGTLPPKVVESNTMSTFTALLMKAVRT